ncbi:MAG: hypoxanthine phosphoribosyltransferase [Thermodesulfobacteriota bacterium]
MSSHLLKQILSADQINIKVRQLGRTISQDYKDLNPVLIGVLNGGFIFLGDLIRNLKIIHEIDFIKISSYTNGSTSRDISLINDISMNITGRNILIVEDIVDTGNSLAYLKKHLGVHKPKNIKTCALIDKKERREVEVSIEYGAFEVDGGFLIGYGMDYKGWGRNLKDIHVLNNKGGK